MFKKGITGLVLVLGVAVLAACTTGTETEEKSEDTSMQTETRNVVEVAQATPTLSTLVSAVVAGDLAAALSDEDTPITVFAPTNTAFTAINDTVQSLLLPANKSALQNVLKYHVVSGKVMAADLKDGQVVNTLAGEKLYVAIKDGKVYINNAMVTSADVAATNGVVHVVNQVLVPGQKTIVELAVATPELSTLVTAVQAAGLVNALSDRTMSYTVFAPVNSGFTAIADTVTTLLLPANKSSLSDVLLYHVVDSKVMSSALKDGQVITTLNGKTLTVDINGSEVMIGSAKVVTADITAANGVVHLIDTVLVP